MSKPILVLNCGSSSIKYQSIDVDRNEVLAKGLVQKIGDTTPGTIDHEVGDAEYHLDIQLPNHTVALQEVVKMYQQYGPNLADTVAVAHRTVHGGTIFNKTTVIDDAVIEHLREVSPLAPLHNPAGIAGIEAARAVLPDEPHVACFDTAFFAALPPEAYNYAIPTELAEKYSVRKYGFHGTSHQYVSTEVSKLLGRDDLKQIVCHLGNGASISAIDSGKPLDTSMGMTPLAGLVMGTRSGDIDPGIIAYLCKAMGVDAAHIDNILNKQSGLLGLTGATDMRDIGAKIEQGDQRAIDGMAVYLHRLVSYVGGYAALLGGLDSIAFTAGVGENAANVRQGVCDRLAFYGVKLDPELNAQRSKQARIISAPDSRVTVLVVPTNEELAMARQAVQVLGL